MTDVVKHRADAPPGFFEAEAAGLGWLAAAEVQGGVRAARVIEVESGRIVIERIRETGPNRDAARAFGRALAATHGAGARGWGAPPDGWDGPLYIGRRELPMGSTTASWGEFYARDRVLPYVQPALAAGFLRDADADLVRQACERIAGGDFDDDDAPARLHGDLWNGNVLWGIGGVVVIDPAAHGGHRETDLAMLALFGCPYLDEVVFGYDEAHPLDDGWRERVPLHQLHPLAVHAAGHGPHYGDALADAARAVLNL
ncbi:fructosamine kinase family protein [Homoserinibacter sp. GY 40078]|uniref:fructosamine kinase family protein n=1 Tax=Homoserinibacter sp. GY 40078 TaxID=2603275 RepID=UPI0011CBFF6E|nr:fructosamine kinase family protein [Homoserinibacter sp. GY 40078]TXK19812.1 phosphotransferase [Homoserinibacter sp. GY 40078]